MNDKLFLRKLAIPIGGILLAVFIGVFLVFPRISKVRSQLAKNQKLLESREDFLQKARLIASLDEEQVKQRASLAALALPKEKDISLILYALSEPARSNGFYIEQLKFNLGEITSSQEGSPAENKEVKDKAVVQKKPVDEVPIEMKVVGSNQRLISFIQSVEKVLPIVGINSFQANYNESGRVSVNLNFYLSISSHRASYDPEKLSLADLALSVSEEELLAQLANFKTTSSAASLDLQETLLIPVGRENPFLLGH